MINDFQYQGPSTNIVFGAGVAGQVGKQARRLGIRRVFFVADPALAESPACRAAIDALETVDINVELFTQIVLDPTDVSIERATQHYRSAEADGLIAFGGGSAMDTAKAVGVLIAAGVEQIAPFYFGGTATPVGIPPLICMPTTAGTGSEVTFVTIVTDSQTQRKLLVRHPSLAPTVALVDPQLSATMPPSLTSSTGFDALAHALEALTSTLASPISDSLAYDAVPRIIEALPRAVANGDDGEARTAMSYAATVAGMAFLSGRVHLGHAVGHSLGAAYHLPHGYACIACMPAILEYIHDACQPQMARLAAMFGVSASRGVPGALAQLMERCAVPRLGAVLQADASIVPELVGHVQGEDRLIGLSKRRPSADEWSHIFVQSL